MLKILIPLILTLLLSSCIQENNPRNLRMGDVTLGQQLVDLKKAYDTDAISESEYEQMKDNFVSAASMCADSDDDDDDDGWFF